MKKGEKYYVSMADNEEHLLTKEELTEFIEDGEIQVNDEIYELTVTAIKSIKVNIV